MLESIETGAERSVNIIIINILDNAIQKVGKQDDIQRSQNESIP